MKINMTLSISSINEAIIKLKAYKKELMQKNELFIERLAEEGISVINATMKDVDLGEDEWNYSIENSQSVSKAKSKMEIKVTGNRLLFVEFGAGVTFSNPQHPKASEMGYGVGTYNPGSDNAFNPDGWWYVKDFDYYSSLVHTYGNAPYMPVYKAGQEMREKVFSIAKEVFGT